MLWALVLDDTMTVSDSYETDAGHHMYQTIVVNNDIGMRDISDLLAAQPGIQRRITGGVGSFQTVSIRGIAGSRIAVFVDGVPQMSAMGGAVDLTRFNGLDIKEIHLYSGIVPASLGGNTLGGAINIITNNSSTDTLSASMTALVGSFGEMRSTFSINAMPHKKLALYSTLDYHRANNDYPYFDRNGTIYGKNATDDDTLRSMDNNRSQDAQFSLGMRYTPKSSTSFNVDWSFLDSDYEIPSSKGTVWKDRNRTAEEEMREQFLTLSQTFSLADRGSATWRINGLLSESTIFWTGHDNIAFPYLLLPKDGTGVILTENRYLNASFEVGILLGNMLKLDSRTDLRHEILLPSNHIDGFEIGERDSRRSMVGLSMDLTLIAPSTEILLGGSIRGYRSAVEGWTKVFSYDSVPDTTRYDHDKSIRASVKQYFGDDDKITLFGNAVFSERIPNLRELYGYQGVLSNALLKPEKSRSAEIGFMVNGPSVEARIVTFINRSDDLIWVIYYGNVGKPENIDQSRTYGIEESVHWKITPFLQITQNATIQNPRILSQRANQKGKLLPDQPKVTIQGEVEIGPFHGFSFHSRCTYRSRYYRDLGNIHAVPADTTINGLMHYSFIVSWQQNKISIEGGVLDLCSVGNSATDLDRIENAYYGTRYPSPKWMGQIRWDF